MSLLGRPRVYAFFGDKLLRVPYTAISVDGHPHGEFGLTNFPDTRADGMPVMCYLAVRKESYTVLGETESFNPEECIALLNNLLKDHAEKLERWYQEDLARFEKEDAAAESFMNNLKASTDNKKAKARKSFTLSNRGLVFDKTDGHCFYCQTKLAFMGNWHVEHKQPISKGGSNEMGNLVAACKACNNKKHTKTAEEFVQQHI